MSVHDPGTDEGEMPTAWSPARAILDGTNGRAHSYRCGTYPETTMIRSTPPAPATGTYRIVAARSTAGFQTNHLFGLSNVAGTFAVRCGHIVIASPVTASRATATIDAASFSTLNRRRDAAVRSAKFLDTAHHPDITGVVALSDRRTC